MTANNMAIFEASTVDRVVCDKARQGLAITVSIVLPCLNEAETLELCIVEAQAALQEAGIDGEVLIGGVALGASVRLRILTS